MRPVVGRRKGRVAYTSDIYVRPTPFPVRRIHPRRHSGESRNPFLPLSLTFRPDVLSPGREEAESNTKTKGEFSEFRVRTPRDNRVVAALPGEKSKWIPAFAGMTVAGFAVFVGATPPWSPLSRRTSSRWTGTGACPYGSTAPDARGGSFSRRAAKFPEAILLSGLFFYKMRLREVMFYFSRGCALFPGRPFFVDAHGRSVRCPVSDSSISTVRS